MSAFRLQVVEDQAAIQACVPAVLWRRSGGMGPYFIFICILSITLSIVMTVRTLQLGTFALDCFAILLLISLIWLLYRWRTRKTISERKERSYVIEFYDDHITLLSDESKIIDYKEIRNIIAEEDYLILDRYYDYEFLKAYPAELIPYLKTKCPKAKLKGKH